jgi:amino-acid N-acetyltransferase
MRFDEIRSILRYVPQFRGRTFVVLVEGEVIASENFANVLLDVAVLHSLSIKIVLVFGARRQIQELAQKQSVALSSADGIGRTDDATMEISLDAISRLGTHLFQQLTAVGLNAAMTNAVIAHPAGVIRGKDLGHTGTIDRIDEKLIEAAIDNGTVPLVAPLGYDRQGRILRLNSSAVATQIAIELRAAKILFVVPDAFVAADGRRLGQLSIDEAKAYAGSIAQGPDASRADQLRHAAKACESGVPRAHFVDGRQEEALLGEVFSYEGVGTMVYADAYQEIRAAKRADIPGIMAMIRQAVDDEELVARSRQEVRENLGDYFVLEIDGNVVGVVAVHSYAADKAAEVACLYIRKSHENLGYGRKLVQFAEKRAKELNAERLFALSTQAYLFFENKLGFSPAEPIDLPAERRAKLEKSGRNSRILVKPLL